MMRTLKYMAALAAVALAAALAACSSDPTEEGGQADPNPLLPQSDFPICWDVKEVTPPSDATRNLIGNPVDDTDTNNPYVHDEYYGPSTTNPNNYNYFVRLQDVCSTDLKTDPLKDKGYAVGLFGDYTYEENGQTVKVADLYRGARLVYLPEVVINEKVRSQWDTNVAMRYWHPDAKYIFRAYYPQRLHGYTISTSNASTMALAYPTQKLQFDLLLGVKEVDTKANPELMKQAVEIQMEHALSALRFAFKLNFKDADFLTSVYLLNDTERSFSSYSTVTYGDHGDINSIKWMPSYNPKASDILYKWVPPLKYWYGYDDNPNDGKDQIVEKSIDEMLAYWGYPTPSDVSGDRTPQANPVLMFSNPNVISPLAGENTPADGENPSNVGANEIRFDGKRARAYYGADTYFDNVTKTVVDFPKDEVADEGTLYCRNSGWLLIPPQESFGKLTLCFTTKEGGEAVYKVALPKKTGTLIDANGKLMRDAAGNLIAESTQEGVKDAWVAGIRYSYLVTLTQTDKTIMVTIDPWNERKHSTEIIF